MIEEILTLAAIDSIVGLAIVVLLKEGLQPLAELEVVLILSLDELIDIDVALNSVFVKGLLQDFVVFDEFVLVFALPPHFAERERVRVKGIHHSTVHRSCGALLNFGQAQLAAF